MKFVFDNIIFSKEKQGGISNYWYHIISRFQQDSSTFFYEEKHGDENIFRKGLILKNIIPHRSLPLPLTRLLPIACNLSSEAIFYHSSFYRQLISKAAVCEVTTVHDFLHHTHSPFLKRLLHNKLKFGAIRRSKGIICVSNHTFRDLKKYYDLKKSQKLTVVYNGVSNEYRVVEKDAAGEKYIKELNTGTKFLLFVGARSNYKNFDFVIDLLKVMPAYKLVIVGNQLSDAEKDKIEKDVLDRIVLASNITNTELNILYNYAHALLYPSSFEGFGIPVVEAMKAGCPVMALDVTSIPEVAGGAALLYPKPDLQQFKEGVVKLENSDYRQGVIEAGLENAKRFDWEKCANETVAFYKDVYSHAF